MPKKYIHLGYYNNVNDIQKYLDLDSAESVIRDAVHNIGAFHHTTDEHEYVKNANATERYNEDEQYLSVWDIQPNIWDLNDHDSCESYIDIYVLRKVDE